MRVKKKKSCCFFKGAVVTLALKYVVHNRIAEYTMHKTARSKANPYSPKFQNLISQTDTCLTRAFMSVVAAAQVNNLYPAVLHPSQSLEFPQQLTVT